MFIAGMYISIDDKYFSILNINSYVMMFLWNSYNYYFIIGGNYGLRNRFYWSKKRKSKKGR